MCLVTNLGASRDTKLWNFLSQVKHTINSRWGAFNFFEQKVSQTKAPSKALR